MSNFPSIILEEMINSFKETVPTRSLLAMDISKDDDNFFFHFRFQFKEMLETEYGYGQTDTAPLDVAAHRNKIAHRIRAKKTHWFKKILELVDSPNKKELDPIKEEYISYQNFAKANQLGNSSEFVLNYEIFNKQRINDLVEWKDNKHEWITNFPYIQKKSFSQIEKAWEDDLLLFVGDFLIKNKLDQPDSYSSLISNTPEIITYPTFSIRSEKMDMKVYEEEKQERKKRELPTEVSYINEYAISNTELLRTIIRTRPDDQLVTNKELFKTLDAKDKSLINFILKRLTSSFYTSPTIEFDIKEAAEHAYNSKNKSIYERTEKKLEKIMAFQFEVIIKKKDTSQQDGVVRWVFFDSLTIDTDANNRRYAKVELGSFVYRQILNNQTIQLYSHLLNKIQGEMASIIVYSLQKERKELYINKDQTEKFLHYDFFLSIVRLNRKRIKENMNKIEEALQEFKDLNFIIKDYSRTSDGFIVQFLSFTDAEKEDYLTENKILPIFPITLDAEVEVEDVEELASNKELQ